jgi:hypothetical protein
MPRPALAILRAYQELVDHSRDRAGRSIFDERAHFIGRWRQTDQVEIEPPNQSPAVGFAARFDPLDTQR